MTILKQRVPLTQDGAQISTQWFKDLQQIATDVSAKSGTIDLSGIIARLTAVETLANGFDSRIKALEGGYQS